MHLTLTTDTLAIALEWYEQLWAFTLTQTWRVPLAHIRAVSTAEPLSHWAEIRAPGTYLPGVIKAGTYYTRRGKEFWYVTADHDYLTLELENESYQRLVLTIHNSQDWAARIEQRLH